MVLSEAARPAALANPGAIRWLEARPAADFAISVLTLGEIQKGAELLPDGRRRERLRAWLRSELPAQFEDRVLPITPAVALAWGRLAAEARRSGRPLHVVDGLLLATAEVHGLTLVTRNVGDFRDRGLPVENPYSP